MCILRALTYFFRES